MRVICVGQETKRTRLLMALFLHLFLTLHRELLNERKFVDDRTSLMQAREFVEDFGDFVNGVGFLLWPLSPTQYDANVTDGYLTLCEDHARVSH